MGLFQWLSLAATIAFGAVTAQGTFDELMVDPQSIVEQQFAAIAPITSESSLSATVQWLDAVSEIMGRVALGGLGQLPVNARKAVETVATVIVPTDALLQDTTVLRKVVTFAPSIWTSGYWYAPLDTWKPMFSAIWSKSVAFAKRSRATGDDSVPFDAAVNATALMIRFTKDSYFINGEQDTFDNESEITSSRAYLSYLPEVVANVSCTPNFTLSELELRTFMNTLHSKRDGMDFSSPFATFTDTSIYRDADIAALRAFLTLA